METLWSLHLQKKLVSAEDTVSLVRRPIKTVRPALRDFMWRAMSMVACLTLIWVERWLCAVAQEKTDKILS